MNSLISSSAADVEPLLAQTLPLFLDRLQQTFNAPILTLDDKVRQLTCIFKHMRSHVHPHTHTHAANDLIDAAIFHTLPHSRQHTRHVHDEPTRRRDYSLSYILMSIFCVCVNLGGDCGDAAAAVLGAADSVAEARGQDQTARRPHDVDFPAAVLTEEVSICVIYLCLCVCVFVCLCVGDASHAFCPLCTVHRPQLIV